MPSNRAGITSVASALSMNVSRKWRRLVLGSARASRAGDDALVIANFFPTMSSGKFVSAGPKPATRGACAPRPGSRFSDTGH